jgi:hypothetical protein
MEGEMTCPEIINSNRPQSQVDLRLFSHLHPEGRQLITAWFQRAWGERDCQQAQAFEPFIYTWFAFNGWAACVTDTDRDREIIDILAADETISNDFAKAIQNIPDVSLSVSNFSVLLPIFDAKTLRRKKIYYHGSNDRQAMISYYLSQEGVNFEPKCWLRHHDAGEALPNDWGHILNAIYKVRCNLFHGEKAFHLEMNQQIVHSAFLVLIYFLNKTGYLYR